MANTYTTYRHMERKLEQLRDFTGNSASGMFTGKHYIVKSKERKCFLMINGSIKAHFETLKEAEV